jgi:hypothetical protein
MTPLNVAQGSRQKMYRVTLITDARAGRPTRNRELTVGPGSWSSPISEKE